jgi:hypothetical protein
MKTALVIGTMVALAGCDDLLNTEVEIKDDADAAVELEIDIAGECSGGWERTDEFGVTTGTKTLVADGTICRIDVAWDGDLISLADMRLDAVEQCGPNNDKCNPDELRLELSVLINDAWFQTGPQRMERSQLIALSSTATTGGATLFTVDKDTTLPLQLGPSDEVNALLRDAYLAGASLPVHATATLDIAMTDVIRSQELAPGGIGVLNVAFTSNLVGRIDAHL